MLGLVIGLVVVAVAIAACVKRRNKPVFQPIVIEAPKTEKVRRACPRCQYTMGYKPSPCPKCRVYPQPLNPLNDG